MSVSQRLSQFISSKRLSLYAFENSIGASRGAISKAIKENKNIGSQVLENILNRYNELNSEWLLTGNGEMLRQDLSIVSEPPSDYGHKKCVQCEDKERIIAQQEVTIEVLRESLTIMKDRIDDLEADRDKKRNSA